MTRERLRAAVRHLRQVVGSHSPGDPTDRFHLERFVAERDEEAFAAIVRRHGPMVLGVCRRVLHDADAADDAFQATFLVLVHRARSLRKPELLGPWLYGVAYRTSLKARSQALRRWTQERQAALQRAAPSGDEGGWAELRSLLDEEIARLPEKYRRPFVLCYLQERTNEETARLLGCPVGTVFSRLAWARQRLRSRLARRGLVLSATALTTLLVEQPTSAAVPPLLLKTTLQAAGFLAAGEATRAAISPQVAALTKEELRAMFLNKLKPVVALVLAVALLGPGAAYLIHGAEEGKPEPSKQEPARPPTADVDTTAKGARLVRTLKVDSPVHALAFSPDGRLVASGGFDSAVTLWDVRTGEPKRRLSPAAEVLSLAFTPDGKTLASGHADKTVLLWDVASGKQVRALMRHPSFVSSVAFAPDGATLATGSASVEGERLTGEIRLWGSGSGELLRTIRWEGQQVRSVAFSPDGARLAAGGGTGKPAAQLWELKEGVKARPLGSELLDWTAALPADDRLSSGGTNRGLFEAYGVCFSPDGKTLAVAGRTGALLLLDLPTRRIRLALMGPRDGHKGTVFSAAFSPGGELLLSGGSDQVAKLWNVRTGKLLQTLEGHKGAVLPVAFSPAGRLLATGSEDGTVKLWRLEAAGKEKPDRQADAGPRIGDEALRRERARLQGVWHRMFAATVYSDLVTQREPGWTIKEDKITYDYRIALAELKEMDRGATYQVNPATSPRQFDLVQADGTTLPGIYLLEGDLLLLCLKKAGQERPKEFVSAPASGQRLLVFQRARKK